MKRPLSWIMIIAVIGAFALAWALFGWPHDIKSAGSFAEFVGVVISPASLILLVLSLDAQAKTERRVAQNHFVSLQVQALIALAEDDRYKLASMDRAGSKDNPAFHAIVKRHRTRVGKLNELVRVELELPELAGED